jgi:hypothetical protein
LEDRGESKYQRPWARCNKCPGNEVNVIGFDTFICFRERTLDFGGKIVGNLNMMKVSKFIRRLTMQFVVVQFNDQKDARKSARHSKESAVDVSETWRRMMASGIMSGRDGALK